MCSFERLPRCAGLPAKIAKITGLILRPPTLGEECESRWGEPHHVAAVRGVKLNKAAIICVFRQREFGTRRASCIHCFCVGSGALCQPLKKIEDQVLHYDVGRFCLRSVRI